MTLNEHSDFLKRAAKQLEATQMEDALLSSLDCIAFIKLRLAKGESAEGGSFSDYDPIYAKKRSGKGLQTAVKDFNVTGRLYASIQPEVASNAAGNVQVNIQAKGEDNNLKVRGARFYKDDEVLAVSQEEIRDVTELHSKRRINRAKGLLGQ